MENVYNSKNQLLYLFIRKTEYDCFINQEFNFSGLYSFHYSSAENKLYGKKSDNINVFDKCSNVSNITAVIGKNGTGKSTLLKFLMQSSKYARIKMNQNNNDFTKDVGFLAIYLLNGKIVFNNFLGRGFEVEGDVFEKTNEQQESNKNSAQTEQFTTIYLSFEDRTDKLQKINSKLFLPLTPKYISNLKSNYIKNNFIEFNQFKTNFNNFDIETILLLDYWSNNPNECNSSQNIEFKVLQFEELYKNKNLKNDSFEPYDLWNEYSIYSLLVHNLIEELKGYNVKIPDELHNYYFSTSDNIETLSGMLEVILGNVKQISYFEMRDYFVKAIDEIKAFFSFAKEKKQIFIDDGSYDSFGVISLNDLKSIFSIAHSKEKNFIIKYLHFNFDRSDGEIAMLRHSSYLYYASHNSLFNIVNEKQLKNNVIILMDEIDVHLHPELQRTLLSKTLNTISKYFLGKTVQLVITSHSPILISDIPSSNVIFLNKDKNGNHIAYKRTGIESFGSNIFDLYNDSFFFDQNILMGEFAKNYIDDLFNKIKSGDYIKEEVIKEIRIIGEPLIRKQLEHFVNYDNKQSCSTRKVDEISKITEKLDSIIQMLGGNKNGEN